MDVLRTPDERFADLPDWPHEPRYAEVPDGEGGTLRVAHVEAGPADGPVVLLLHGEPTWSYLYRHVIPPLVDAGCRVVAPDLVGFGRSDKPTRVADHTYARHVEWLRVLCLDVLGLEGITLVGQDWGSLLGLRLVAEHPDAFARVVAANALLPTGDEEMPEAWWRFRRHVEATEDLAVGSLVASGCAERVTPGTKAAYDAPFPSAAHKAGPKAMPLLMPTESDDPASEANRQAWRVLARLDTPFLCAFSDRDPITRPWAELLRRSVLGAHGRPHTTIEGAGHFLQEDRGAELGRVVADFVRST